METELVGGTGGMRYCVQHQELAYEHAEVDECEKTDGNVVITKLGRTRPS